MPDTQGPLENQVLKDLLRRTDDQPPEDINPEAWGNEEQAQENKGAVRAHALKGRLARRREEELRYFLSIQGKDGYEVEEEKDQIDEDQFNHEG